MRMDSPLATAPDISRLARYSAITSGRCRSHEGDADLRSVGRVLYWYDAPYRLTCLEQCFTPNDPRSDNDDTVWSTVMEREAIDASSFMSITTVRCDGEEEREGVRLKRTGDGSVTVATLDAPKPELEMPATVLFPSQQMCLFLHAIARGEDELFFDALHPEDESYAASANSRLVPHQVSAEGNVLTWTVTTIYQPMKPDAPVGELIEIVRITVDGRMEFISLDMTSMSVACQMI